MIENLIKKRLKEGDKVFGTWSILSSPEAMSVMSAAGLDFIIIDMEHTPTSFETAQHQVFSTIQTTCTPIIRLGDKSESNILRALDLGTQSIMLSHVSSGEEARQIVRHSKYFPEGERGLSPFTIHHGYTDSNLRESMIQVNEQLFIGVLVEGEKGLENFKDIAAVDGIDMLYLGVYDITQSLGIPGDVFNPEVIKVLRKCVQISQDYGKAVGSVARDKEYLDLMLELGFSFVSYRNDSFVLREGLEEACGWFSENR